MNIKFISIAILFIILILILSEINNSKTKQQLQNDRREAEERLKGFKENF
jgi:preprotein translocase subunit SecG